MMTVNAVDALEILKSFAAEHPKDVSIQGYPDETLGAKYVPEVTDKVAVELDTQDNEPYDRFPIVHLTPVAADGSPKGYFLAWTSSFVGTEMVLKALITGQHE